MITTYYFIRHCEKEYDGTYDPPLTSKGKRRANYWMQILYPKNIDLVFCTPLIRTQETAQPLLQKLQLHYQLYDPTDLYNVTFQHLTQGKTSLIVGHQDTTPTFINRILKKRKYNYIKNTQFANLYTVVIKENGNIDSQLTVHEMKI